MRIRLATADDVDAVARLHADSWRRHYRGAYLDSYLDGDVVTDRIAVWTERLAQPCADTSTLVVDEDGALVGFAHTIYDDDPTWGALLDNLHVRHDVKRRGVGRWLLRETALALADRRPASGLYLFVLEQNTPAQAFYASCGGRCVQRRMGGPFPGGGTAPSLRYAWPDLGPLVRGTFPPPAAGDPGRITQARGSRRRPRRST